MHRVIYLSNLSYRSDAIASMENEIVAMIKTRPGNAQIIGFYHRPWKNDPRPVYETIKQKIVSIKKKPREPIINVVFHSSCSAVSIVEHMEQLRKKLPGHNLVFYYYKKEEKYLGALSKILRDYSEFESKIGIQKKLVAA